MTKVQTLLASYGQPINFRGYSRTLSSIVTEEQKYQLSSQYKFVFIDSSTEATTCGKEASTKRIIVDALKSDSIVTSSSSSTSVVATSNGSTNGNSNNSKSLLSTMCFITADNDIQFLLSTLDRPQIFKILITSSEPLLQQLTTYTKGCNLTFSWDDIESWNTYKTMTLTTTTTTTTATNHSPVAPILPVVREKPKRGINYTESLQVYRNRYLSSASTAERIAVLCEIDCYLATTYKTKTCNLMGDARAWYVKNVTKVMKCITNCHNGNTDTYIADAVESTAKSKKRFNSRTYQCKYCLAQKSLDEDVL